VATPAPVELAGREEGAGPPVLLLHGLGNDHTVWNGLRPLAESYRLLAPDLRGHGRTPLPEGSTFSFPELLGDLDAYRAAKGVGRVHLVGTSAGGFLALRMALDRPETVASLTLVSSAAQCDGHTRSVLQSWVESYRTEGFDTYVLQLLKDVYYPEWLEAHLEVIDEAKRSLRDRDLRGSTLWGQAVRNFDCRSQLGKLGVPVLAVHGMDDRVIDASHSRLLRQAIRGAELKLFPFTGHMVPVERAEELRAVLAEWWARAGRGDPGAGARPAPPRSF
jgi:pimeloyl-ACP methyl ester carboxylesterase